MSKNKCLFGACLRACYISKSTEKGYEQKKTPFVPCLRVCCIPCEYIYKRRLLLNYLNIKQKEATIKNENSRIWCRRLLSLTIYKRSRAVDFSSNIDISNQQNKATNKIEAPVTDVCACWALQYINILRGGLLLVLRYNAQNAGFQKGKGTRLWLVCFEVKWYNAPDQKWTT